MRQNSGGSLYVTRPSVVHYTATHGELLARADDVFAELRTGGLRAAAGQRWPVTAVSQALTALEAWETAGKLLLTVGHG